MIEVMIVSESPVHISPTRRGAWLVNVSKHLLRYERAHPGLQLFENAIFAGQCGSLLIKLSSDEDEETISRQRVVAHARLCGIDKFTLKSFLGVLKSLRTIDWNTEQTEYRLLAFTRERVLRTVNHIFSTSLDIDAEKRLPELLEFCLVRPRFGSEIRDAFQDCLTKPQVDELLSALETFRILGARTVGKDKLFFNTYQFTDKAERIGKALQAFTSLERQQLDDLLGEVRRRPGIPAAAVDISDRVRRMAVGLGLVDANTVRSPAGEALFYTAPLFSPPSVGEEISHLEADVFNHAKVLLASLRYGETYSTRGRGKIVDPNWITSALLHRDAVGPCTAIGQDYVLLESEGVIRTTRARHKSGEQYFMSLRRREPAELVRSLLESAPSNSSGVDVKALPTPLNLPSAYDGPEGTRAALMQTVLGQDERTTRRFLEALRS